MSATTEQLITMTPEAVAQLKKFLEEQGTPDHALRVFVAPGGCSGLQYGMTIEETAEEDDTIVDIDGVRLLVDSFSAMYLQGAEVDYVNSLMGGGFTVRNPNAVASCACGHSFDAGGNAGTSHGCGCGA
ncbi:MAG TPA: iron-sulfur cluster insertion protein ErpA [Thermomicrobiales bacterium]|jgi:iron-sulfur cluster assembly protein